MAKNLKIKEILVNRELKDIRVRLYLGNNVFLEITSWIGASDLRVSLEGSTNHQLTIRPASSRCISIEVGK